VRGWRRIRRLAHVPRASLLVQSGLTYRQRNTCPILRMADKTGQTATPLMLCRQQPLAMWADGSPLFRK
jgi:hypothetical protein